MLTPVLESRILRLMFVQGLLLSARRSSWRQLERGNAAASMACVSSYFVGCEPTTGFFSAFVHDLPESNCSLLDSADEDASGTQKG